MTILDHSHKGIPASLLGHATTDVGHAGLNILAEDMMFPIAILRQSALDHNSRWMRDFLAHSGAKLCPHGKTTMSPELFARQMADGAWGMTAATPSHVRIYRQFGIQRILMANQLLGRENIDYVLNELRRDPAFDFYCLVDSVRSVDILVDALRRNPVGRPLQLLLEVGSPGGRTGVRDHETGHAVAAAVAAASPLLALRGVEAFEGIFPPDVANESRIRTMIDSIVRLAMDCETAGFFAPGPVILTAGGSAFFDMAAFILKSAPLKAPVDVILRSGCYLTADNGTYKNAMIRFFERNPELRGKFDSLQPALEVWSYIQSIPEPHRAIAAFGKRDISHDIELPHACFWYRPGLHQKPVPVAAGVKVTALNDQHAYLALPDNHGLDVGDLIGVGISHPCTTFDKWKAIPVVDDDYAIISMITTCF